MTTRNLLGGIAISIVLAACGGSASPDATPATIDADPNAPDANTTPDADLTLPDASTMGVACGTATCDPMTQDCCVTPDPSGGAPTFACGATGTCAGAALSCDGPEDCDVGDVCCARGGGGGGVEATCGPTCNGPAAVVVCHVEADCDTGELCCPSPLGYAACAAVPTCP